MDRGSALVPNSHGAVLNQLYEELLRNAISIPDESTEARRLFDPAGHSSRRDVFRPSVERE